MAVYTYEVVTQHGDVLDGELESTSLTEAKEQLDRQYSVVLSVTQRYDIEFSGFSKLFKKKVQPKDNIQLFRNLKSLLDAGLPFDESLLAMQSIIDSKVLIEVIEDIHIRMQDGEPFSSCLAFYPDLFESSMVAMVKAGEATGQLGVVLGELADLIEWEFEMRKAIKKAIRYPVMVISAGVLAVLVIVTVVIPKFSTFFSAQSQELPLMTQILLGVNAVLRGYWMPLIIGGIGTVIGYRFCGRYPPTKAILDPLYLKIPLVGSLMRKYMVARFTRFFFVAIS